MMYCVSGIEYRVSGIRYRESDIGYRVSRIGYRVSSIRYQVSGIENRDIEISRYRDIEISSYRVSSIEYRVSSIELSSYRVIEVSRYRDIEVSSIENRISGIEYQVSSIWYLELRTCYSFPVPNSSLRTNRNSQLITQHHSTAKHRITFLFYGIHDVFRISPYLF